MEYAGMAADGIKWRRRKGLNRNIMEYAGMAADGIKWRRRKGKNGSKKGNMRGWKKME